MKKKFILKGTKCLSRNYQTPKKKEQANQRIELMKYCPKCNAHTLHKESK